MRASRLSYVAITLAVVLAAFVGCSNTRSRSTAKPRAQAPHARKSAAGKPAGKPEASVPKVSLAETAIRAAARKNRYVFVTFYRESDEASSKMRAVVKAAQRTYARRASFVSVDVDDPVHQDVVSRYGADRSPIPLTLAVAPNGAVTAGFPNEVKSTDFPRAFVSDGMADVVKAMQNQKLAVLCVQGPRARHNKETLAAARKLAAAPELAGATQLVRVNSADRREAKLLQQLKVNAGSPEAQIVVIAPPGKVAGKFSGPVPTETMVASVTQACGPGGSCGPSG